MTDVPTNTTWHIAGCLERLHCDGAARSELINHARRRLQELAERMFLRFPRLHDKEQAVDVYQEAMLRLWRSLDEQRPTTVTEFMGLAALQMRRSLQDLARSHFGRKKEDSRAGHARPVVHATSGYTFESLPDDHTAPPEVLICWAEFHAAADRLPEPERTVFDLVYYNEVPQVEVAELLGVSDRQVRRYWQTARRLLLTKLEAVLPAERRDWRLL